MTAKTEQSKCRMTIDMSLRSKEKLEAIARESGQDLSRVIARAFALYDLVWEKSKDGQTLICRKKDSETEIVLDEFETSRY